MPPETEAGEESQEEYPDENIIKLDSGEDEEETDQADAEEDPQDSEEQEETQVDAEEEVEPEDEIKEQLSRLRAENEKLQKDRDRAFYNLRKAKAESKPDKKDSEVDFSDAQLLQLIEEHREDPAVMLQLMKQVSMQQGKAQAVDAVKTQEVKKVKQEMDTFLLDNFPAYIKEDTTEGQELSKARSLLHVEDHPFGDFLSVAGTVLMKMPAIQQAAYEKGKAEALKKNGEDTRKKTIKESGLGAGKPKTRAAEGKPNNSGAKAVAKQMGMTDAQYKRYVQILKGADKRQSFTVDG